MEHKHPTVALVSSANDPYVGQLSEMLESIGPALDGFALKILDLGLSAESKDRLRHFQADAEFLDPGWPLPFPGHESAPNYKKVFVSKPFLPDFFPGYSGFIWIDADIWLQDASALQDYVAAASRTGAAFSFESHPLYRSIQKIRRLKIGNWVYIKGFKDYFLNKCSLMFGTAAAVKIGFRPVLNSGIFYMDAKSPIWNAWQSTMRSANLKRHQRFAQICDQTCLQVAIIQGGLDHSVLPATYNWLPRLAPPVFDAESGCLLDPMFPHGPVKVIHLVDGGHKEEFDLPLCGGGKVATGLGLRDFRNLQSAHQQQEA